MASSSNEFASFAADSTNSNNDTTTVVNWWELVLISVGPVIAFLYALVVAIFLPAWGECSYTSHLFTLMPRNSLCIFAVAFTVHRSQHVEQRESGFRLLVAVAISAAASYYLMQETRRHQVQGGPEPELVSLLPDNSSEAITVVVTGANTGIGLETARQFYEHGATVVMACRSLKKAEEARAQLISDAAASATNEAETTTTLGSLEIQVLDLGSLESVRQAAKALLKKYKTIDVLVNNAGVMLDQQVVTSDGFDLTMQANYLGHYLLTRLLLPSIRRSKDPRIINITSSTYTLATRGIDLEDLHCQNNNNKTKRPYTLFGQYAQSKLAQILMTRYMAPRYPGITIAAVHPGLVRTNVVRNLPAWMKVANASFSWIVASLQKTPEQGAWNTLHCATCQDPVTGAYWVNRRVQSVRPCAESTEDAAALWKLSAEMVGLEE